MKLSGLIATWVLLFFVTNAYAINIVSIELGPAEDNEIIDLIAHKPILSDYVKDSETRKKDLLVIGQGNYGAFSALSAILKEYAKCVEPQQSICSQSLEYGCNTQPQVGETDVDDEIIKSYSDLII